jgi:aldehyde dehydrogenase
MQTPRNAEAPIIEYMLIDGQSVDGTERIEVRNPARPDELVGTIVRGTPAHVGQAVAAAKARQPAWAGLSFTQRAGVLKKALSRLEPTLIAAPLSSSARTASRWRKRAASS